MPKRLLVIVPWLTRLSITVGISESESGERVPAVRPTGPSLIELRQTESGIVTRASAPQDSVNPFIEAARARSDTDGLLGDDEAGGESDLVGVLGA
jgi:hypothetical protein